MIKIKYLLVILLLWIGISASAQDSLTVEYAVKDTSHLKMDVFYPKVQNEQHSCMIFVHGGGFINGSRKSESIPQFVKMFNDKGYVVISIDYRLGLKGQSNYSVISGIKKFETAIDMAAEDLLSAVDYTLKDLVHNDRHPINPDKILLCGSSAGAITVLQADYYLNNGADCAKMLPKDFHFAGVISFSGGIYSKQWKVKYRKHAPAPTLLCHGTADQLVPYNQIQLLNVGMFGSNALAKRFEKYDYPYCIRRYKEVGHQVAMRYITDSDLIFWFIDNYVTKNQHLKVDELFYTPDIPHPEFSNYKIRDLKSMK